MHLIQDTMWNNVVIYGPQSEIDRFKRECLCPFPLDNVDDRRRGFDPKREVWIETDTVAEITWNFRETGDHEPNTYAFGFDTSTRFPDFLFESLAELFPMLSFDCDCIADDDSSMGFGWFNPPPGGENFRDDYDVPKDHWTNGAWKRDPTAAALDRARIDKLLQTIREAK